MSPHSDPSRCVRWSCDAPCRKLLFIVSEKVRQMAPGVGLGRPSSGPEEATSKWGRSYKWVADLKITWRGGKRRGTVTDRASRRGGEGRGGEGNRPCSLGSATHNINFCTSMLIFLVPPALTDFDNDKSVGAIVLTGSEKVR